MTGPPHAVKLSEDYKRLQSIEQKVVQCIDLSAEVMEELSRVGNLDRTKIAQLCSRFMDNIKDAHTLVQEGVTHYGGERSFELHAYHALARAQVNSEKLDVVLMHLDGLQRILQDAGYAPRALSEEPVQAPAALPTQPLPSQPPQAPQPPQPDAAQTNGVHGTGHAEAAADAAGPQPMEQ